MFVGTIKSNDSFRIPAGAEASSEQPQIKMSTIEPHRVEDFPWKDAKCICLRWEKWRILYNIILLVAGIIRFLPCLRINFFYDASFCFRPHLCPFHETSWYLILLLYGIFANVCYFLGPFTEVFLLWLGFSWKRISLVLFVCGTLYAISVLLFMPNLIYFVLEIIHF